MDLTYPLRIAAFCLFLSPAFAAQSDGPLLSIASGDPTNFYAGQNHATYSFTVFNASAQGTNSAVTVGQTLPAGLSLVSMSGSGWSCQGATCMRSDLMGGFDSFPPITVTVNIDCNAASPLTISTVAAGGGSPDATDETVVTLGPAHFAFFAGETTLAGNGWTFLQIGNGFGYYNISSYPWIYHLDLGWEYCFDAHDASGGIYFFDAASQHFWYTNRSAFPYLYDFTLKAWLFYFADAAHPGRYSSSPRSFANLATGNVITM